MHENWSPTRHGGFRRTRVAQQVGTPDEASSEARGMRMADVDDDAESGQYLEERLRHTEKVVGSNPAPGTSRYARTWSTRLPAGVQGTLESAATLLRPGKFIIKLNEQLGLPTCPYLIRWRAECPWFSIRLHHWLGPDDDRHRHDHPWDFITFVLKGGYTDLSPAGDSHLRAPAVQHRAATHKHTVVPDPGGAWTLLLTGPKVRQWGFWVGDRFRKANKYFFMYGHHPCE